MTTDCINVFIYGYTVNFNHTIKIKAIDTNGNKLNIDIVDYDNYIYVKGLIGEKISIDSFKRLIKPHILPKITNIEKVMKYDMFYYINEPNEYFKVSYNTIKPFDSKTFMVKTHVLSFEEGEENNSDETIDILKSYEADVSILNKLFNDSLLTPNGYFLLELNESSVNSVNSVSPKNIKKVDDINKPPIPDILSFDIETFYENGKMVSDHKSVDTELIQICCIYRDTTGKYTEYIFNNGNLEYDGINIFCGNEEQCIIEFFKLIEKLNPIILTGYNINGYDLPYLLTRMIKPYKGITLSNFNSVICINNNLTNTIVIDMLNVVKIDKNYPTNKLSIVSKELFGSSEEKNKIELNIQEMFKMYINYVKSGRMPCNDMKIITKYCLQDAYLPILIFDKLDTWYNLLEKSNLSKTNSGEIYKTGNARVSYTSKNLLYSYLSSNNYVFQHNIYTELDEAKVEYKGGSIPKNYGIFKNVVPLDVSSMYPNQVIKNNICYTTLYNEDGFDYVPDKDLNIITLDNGFVVKFYKNKIGVLPQMMKYLLDARKIDKNEMKKYSPSDTEYKILNAKQLSKKLCANGMYGFVGQRFSKYNSSCVVLASCITKVSREFISSVETHLTKMDMRVVYIHTDSNYVEVKDNPKLYQYIIKLLKYQKIEGDLLIRYQEFVKGKGFFNDDDRFLIPKTNNEKIWNMGILLGNIFSFIYEKPMVLAFEQEIYPSFIALGGNRNIKTIYDCKYKSNELVGSYRLDNQGKIKIESTGSMIVKKNIPDICKSVCKELYGTIFDSGSEFDVYINLINSLHNIIINRDISQLAIMCNYNSDKVYKGFIPKHVQLYLSMKERGIELDSVFHIIYTHEGFVEINDYKNRLIKPLIDIKKYIVIMTREIEVFVKECKRYPMLSNILKLFSDTEFLTTIEEKSLSSIDILTSIKSGNFNNFISTTIYCEICKKDINKSQYDNHIILPIHLNNMDEFTDTNSKHPNYCITCKKIYANITKHNNSKIHLDNIDKTYCSICKKFYKDILKHNKIHLD